MSDEKFVGAIQPGMVCKWCKCRIPAVNCVIAPCNANPNHVYAHEFEFPKEENANSNASSTGN